MWLQTLLENFAVPGDSVPILCVAPTQAMAASMLSYMPHDVWAGIAGCLSLRDVGELAPCCKTSEEESSDGEFWFHVFMRSCWPRSSALLAFAEGGSADLASVDWRQRLRTRSQTSPALVVDIGRGYSKYGIVHGVRGRPDGDGQPPRLVQHCSSPTHPPDCDHRELMPFIHRELNQVFQQAAMDSSHSLHAVAVGGAPPLKPEGVAVLRYLVAKPELNGRVVRLDAFDEERERWAVTLVLPSSNHWNGDDAALEQLLLKPENLIPVRRAQDLPLVLGEPFAATASRGQTGEYDAATSSWARAQLGQLRSRPGLVHIVPQAQMSLWAFGVNHGIVVNIGQGQTIAIPVIDGEIGTSLACSSEVASGSLTSFMRQLLSQRFDWFDGRHLTFSRDLKEAHCYVAPPSLRSSAGSLRSRIEAGVDVGIRPVTVEGPQIRNGRADDFELTTERVLVPELFFDSEIAGGPALPELIVNCVAKVLASEICDAEGARRLLRQVVLVGGAADIPGIRPRTEHEIRSLLQNGQAPAQVLEAVTDANDVFVLNPPRAADGPLTSPRFVPFIGGCVRAVSSERLVPLAPSDAAELDEQPRRASLVRTLARNQGLRMWASRERMNLSGPSIFRTGGGGGEDDRIWQALQLALEEIQDEDSSEEEEEEALEPHVFVDPVDEE